MRRSISLASSLAIIALLTCSSWLPPNQSASAGQGKGGTIKPVPTPTPGPKKVTTKKSTTPSGRGNTNQNVKSKEDEAAATERTYWESIRSSTDAEDFRAYLKRYPNGVYADLANNRIKALEAAKTQPAPTPAPTPEPTYEWAKPERDLPGSVRLEFHTRELSFSVPSGWTRTKQEEGTHYLQINFRAPDSPQTNISIQCYVNGIPRTLRNGSAELWNDEKKLIDYRRNQYASQNVSAKLTDTEVVNHSTGRWHTFTADVLDVSALERSGGLVPALDAAYPDDVWLKTKPYPDLPDQYGLKPGSLSAFTRTRHSYAIRQAGGDFVVMLYTAPIEKFDEKMLPSVMATLKMSGSTIEFDTKDLAYSETEIVIDGERKSDAAPYKAYPVSVGKHHVTVRAKEHKPFEKDVFIGGWEALVLEVKLERTVSGTSGVKPK
jgi:hypothetical protein